MTLLDQYIEELKSVRAAIMKLTADPTVSTSVSSANGGSYSASFVNLSQLHAREAELTTRIAEMYRESELYGSMSLSYPIYCGG